MPGALAVVSCIAVLALAVCLSPGVSCQTGRHDNASAVPPMPSNGIIIRMPTSELLDGTETTRISGRDGLCVDVKDGDDHDGNSIIVWPCHSQPNQQWTLQNDGTIRCLGKCMTASGNLSGDYVMIFDCDTAPELEATRWTVATDGTITNLGSGLVLTAPGSVEWGTILTVELNIQAASQAWRVADDVEPTVMAIMGFKSFCMQAQQKNTRMWVEACVANKEEQKWAFYSDGTIRVNADRSQCLTSDGSAPLSVITIFSCQGLPKQRWLFKQDKSIFNPGTGMVVDVKENNVSLHQIILYPFTGEPNQQWVPVFY